MVGSSPQTQRAGVKCGDFTLSDYAPGLYFGEQIDSVGYSGIIQSLGGYRLFWAGGQSIVPFTQITDIMKSGAQAQLSRSQLGNIEIPENGAGQVLSENGFSSFSIRCNVLSKTLVMTARLQFSQQYNRTFSPTVSGSRLFFKSRSYSGPPIGIEQVLEGGPVVDVVLSWDNFTFGSETIQWQTSEDRVSEFGEPVEAPEPGSVLDELAPITVQIYDPGRGCCSGTYCDEQNPLP